MRLIIPVICLFVFMLSLNADANSGNRQHSDSDNIKTRVPYTILAPDNPVDLNLEQTTFLRIRVITHNHIDDALDRLRKFIIPLRQEFGFKTDMWYHNHVLPRGSVQSVLFWFSTYQGNWDKFMRQNEIYYASMQRQGNASAGLSPHIYYEHGLTVHAIPVVTNGLCMSDLKGTTALLATLLDDKNINTVIEQWKTWEYPLLRKHGFKVAAWRSRFATDTGKIKTLFIWALHNNGNKESYIKNSNAYYAEAGKNELRPLVEDMSWFITPVVTDSACNKK